MSALTVQLVAAAWLALLGGGAWTWRRVRDKRVQRRVQRAIAMHGGEERAATPGAEVSIFRPVEGRSWLARLGQRVEARYPLLDARRTLPKAAAFGLAMGAGAWGAMWFLEVASGWWTIPSVAAAAVAAGWYALSWFQARRATEFVRQFPEVVDQIVRLAGAGVPPLQAIAVVSEDAKPPVAPILCSIRDGLMAGLDADITLRAASERVRLAEFTLFTAVIGLQRRAGGGISAPFSNLATTLRERRSTALKARASTAQTRLTLLVLTLLPVVVLVAQNFIAPQSVEILFNSEQGQVLLRLGIGLIVAGLLIARSIGARGER